MKRDSLFANKQYTFYPALLDSTKLGSATAADYRITTCDHVNQCYGHYPAKPSSSKDKPHPSFRLRQKLCARVARSSLFGFSSDSGLHISTSD